MEEEESRSSSTLAITVLALVGVVAVGAPIVSVAGIALVTDMQAAMGQCSPSAVVSDEDSEDAVINVPNGWGPLVEEAAKTAGLPVSVVAAQLKQESNWNPNAGSSAGAQGIAQFMPETWAQYGNGGNVTDPEDAIPAYGRYMADLKNEVKSLAGNDADQLVRLTLAAYNAGPGAVAQHKGVPPFAETQRYVERILDGGQIEFSPGCEAPTGGKAWDGDLGEGEWTTPLPGGKFTSGYGRRNVPGVPEWAQDHVGLDFATPGAGSGAGGPVIAPTDLRITGFNAADGCVIAKEDGDDPDFGFAFCHLNSWGVKKGQKLSRGDVIGVEGNRGQFGMSTHLHIEIYKPNAPDVVFPYQGFNIDPEPILREKGAWPA
ncbi:transglycosylase SLT domain-containing protein [Kocuria oceani]|uniref:Transglycosylase SLT domain-containing protein n=1 Tax=Kocuria oceani TaxID=988827 RepID=A0ABV9TLH8_9MICC|nr:transglycosylase SLT domain-containing protein [Kocuria oceani]